MLDSTLLERSRRLILEELADCWDITLLHGPGNLGDRLILAGTHELLSAQRYRELAVDELADARGETCLLLGSGAFTRAYHEWAPWALRLAQRRFGRVVVLPSTFDVSVPAVRDVLAHTGAVVFAREPRSYAAISELCDARMALDGSFFFDYEPHMQPGSGVLEAFRTDAEAPADWQPPPQNRDISAVLTSLDDWLKEIARHAVVRTNRAHVMIAAALLGKTVEVGPCEQFKVREIAQWALGGLPVHFVPLPDQRRRPSATQPRAPRPGRPRTRSRVTAVIATHERPQLALRALRSVRAHAQADAIVLDDGSSASARAMLAAALADQDGVRLLATDQRLGCAGARARALREVDSELVLLLDSDAELQAGALDALVAELDDHPCALAAAACVALPDGRIQHCGGEMRERDGVLTFTLGELAGRPVADAAAATAHRCEWVAHTAVLCRTRAFGEFALDERLRSYYEDNEWSFRVAMRHSDAFRAVPAALVVHDLATDRHRPGVGSPGDFAQRCAELAGLQDFVHFHDRHGLVLAHLFSVFDHLRLPDGAFDVDGARLLLALARAIEPAALLDHWCAGTLAAVIDGPWRKHSLALAAQLAEKERQAHAAAARARDLEREVSGALEGLSAVSSRLEAMRQTRVWRWACAYWELRDAARKLLRAAASR
jgi:GT2 family glycosyltransferase